MVNLLLKNFQKKNNGILFHMINYKIQLLLLFILLFFKILININNFILKNLILIKSILKLNIYIKYK